jgi:hypothetical protein
MDDLEIKIAITYKVPKINLTLNGLLRGLDRKKVKSGAAENSAVLWSDLLSTAIDMIPWTKAEITSGKIRGYKGYKLREPYKKYPNLEANNPISWIYP